MILRLVMAAWVDYMAWLMERIRRLPVEVGSLSHYLQGFIHPRWLCSRISQQPTKINALEFVNDTSQWYILFEGFHRSTSPTLVFWVCFLIPLRQSKRWRDVRYVAAKPPRWVELESLMITLPTIIERRKWMNIGVFVCKPRRRWFPFPASAVFHWNMLTLTFALFTHQVWDTCTEHVVTVDSWPPYQGIIRRRSLGKFPSMRPM